MSHRRPRWIAALALCALLSAACATARSTATNRTSAQDLGWQPAVDAVYARVAGAISRPGEVYTPTIHSLETQGDLAFTTVTNAWIDVAGARARGEIEASFPPDITKHTDWIISGRAYHQTLEYDPAFKRAATTCRGSDDPLLAIIIGCRGEAERGLTATYAPYNYKGRDSVAVMTVGSLEGPGQRAVFADTLFLDAATYLPIALEGGGRVETLDASGAVVAAHGTGRFLRYDHAFAPPADLDEGFFDPEAIGFEDTDPIANITKPVPDFTAFWLGPEAALDGLPPLTVRDATIAGATDRPALRYRAAVSYRPLTDEFGPALLQLQEWRLDEWKAMESVVLNAHHRDPCLAMFEIESADRRATIFASRTSRRGAAADCNAPPDAYAAAIWLGQTVVLITPDAESPYNSEDALRSVVAALTPAN